MDIMAQNWPASCMPRVLRPVTNPHCLLARQFYALPARPLMFVQDSVLAQSGQRAQRVLQQLTNQLAAD